MHKIVLFLICLLFLIYAPFLLSIFPGSWVTLYCLKKEFKEDLQIDSFRLSWLGPQRFSNVRLTRDGWVGELGSFETDVPLWSFKKAKQTFRFKGGSLSFSMQPQLQIKEMEGSFSKHILIFSGQTNQTGSFLIEGVFESQDRFDLKINGKQLPTQLLDSFYQAKGWIVKIVGDVFDLAGNVSLNQPQNNICSLQFSSSFMHASIDAALSQNTLSLTKPFQASIQVSKPLTDALLQWKGQSVFKSIQFKNPIEVSFEQNQFSCPIPFSLKALQVQKGTIDLGQSVAHTEGPLASLLTFLKTPDVAKNLSIWMAPLYFSIKKGILQIERVDGLFNHSTQLCFWGQYSFLHDTVQSYLGIPGETLSHAFKIKGFSPHYAIKIPITGSLSQLNLDTNGAIRQIGAMLAGKEVGKKNQILGTLIDVFGQMGDTKAPPPKRPFPWEEEKAYKRRYIK